MRINSNRPMISIKLSWFESLWSLRRVIEFKKAHVVSVEKGKPKARWNELRVPGTYFPGVIKAGTYISGQGRSFWYVTCKHQYYLTINLKDEAYSQLVLGFKDKAEVTHFRLRLSS